MRIFFIISALLIMPIYGTYHSQVGQDKFVHHHFFQNKLHGVFVDIGAHDGIRYNNTYFFERKLKWTGLCIEPMPEVFEQLKANRSAVCIQGCINDKPGKAQFLRITNNATKNDGPEMLSGLVSKYNPKHLERITSEVAENGANTEVIEVDCYRLNDLLEQYGLYHIDYLSLDIEGGELDVLKSIDYDRFKIYIIDVENNYNNPEFKKFLATKGFTFIKEIAGDEFYVNRRNKK